MLRVSAHTPGSRAQRCFDVVRRFRGKRVVVLGDLVSDEFVYGDIARISREAPVLILEHRRTAVVPGGAGNAVANLRALGARPIPVGVSDGTSRDGDSWPSSSDGVSPAPACCGAPRSAHRARPACSPAASTPAASRSCGSIAEAASRCRGRSPRRSAVPLRQALKHADGVLIADYGTARQPQRPRPR